MRGRRKTKKELLPSRGGDSASGHEEREGEGGSRKSSVTIKKRSVSCRIISSKSCFDCVSVGEGAKGKKEKKGGRSAEMRIMGQRGYR